MHLFLSPPILLLSLKITLPVDHFVLVHDDLHDDLTNTITIVITVTLLTLSVSPVADELPFRAYDDHGLLSRKDE